VIVGVGLGLGDPAFDAMLARSAPGGHMGMTFGLFRTATSFMAMPAPYLGGLLYGRVSSLTPFWSGAIFLLAAAVFTWFYLRPHAERAAAQISSAD
jgi:MFS family permease